MQYSISWFLAQFSWQNYLFLLDYGVSGTNIRGYSSLVYSSRNIPFLSPVANQVSMESCRLYGHTESQLCRRCSPPAPEHISHRPHKISTEVLNQLFPLFLETQGGFFQFGRAEAQHWYERLGFSDRHTFRARLYKLAAAKWLVRGEKPGQYSWNQEQVAPEWYTALERFLAGK